MEPTPTDALYKMIGIAPNNDFDTFSDEDIITYMNNHPYDTGYVNTQNIQIYSPFGQDPEQHRALDYPTPLLLTTRVGRTRIINALAILYKNGKQNNITYFDPNYTDPKGNNALMYICANYPADILVKDQPIVHLIPITDLRMKNNNGNDALTLLLHKGFDERAPNIATFFIDTLAETNRFNPESVNNDGVSAFMMACAKKRLTAVNKLVSLKKAGQINIDIGRTGIIKIFDNNRIDYRDVIVYQSPQPETALSCVCNLYLKSKKSVKDYKKLVTVLLLTGESNPSVGGNIVKDACTELGLRAIYEKAMSEEINPFVGREALMEWKILDNNNNNIYQLPQELIDYVVGSFTGYEQQIPKGEEYMEQRRKIGREELYSDIIDKPTTKKQRRRGGKRRKTKRRYKSRVRRRTNKRK
jgi:hypothetical protein